MATALVDLSILRTEARVRGIGRYVSELALGLEQLAAEASDLGVEFVEDVRWGGQLCLTRSASEALERLAQRPVEAHKRWAYRWRLNIARGVRARGAELFHQGYPNVTPLGRLGAVRLVTCHDLIPLMYPEHYASLADGFESGRRWLDRRRFGSADHVLAISRATASVLQLELGLETHKISVVHNGIDLARWSGASVASAVPSELVQGLGAYFLYVGDGDWRKNHVRVFEALRQVRERLPQQDLKLVWAAKLSSGRQQLVREQAARAGVSDAVRLLGYVSDGELRQLYASAVATVFVSLAEGFGLPVLESMAMGCAVVTSDCSSLAEIGAGAALLVDPESVAAIAQGLCYLAEDRTRAAALAVRGTARSLQFSLERQARETLALYRRCLTLATPS